MGVADVVDHRTRSKMMSGIRGTNTKPELAVRRSLHARGFRYKLHAKGLPGKPDLVLPKYQAAIFVHGCFWHQHDCHLFKWPKTREQFWKDKLTNNVARDKKNIDALLASGWRVLVVWECSIKNADAPALQRVVDQAEQFLAGSDSYAELPSRE